MTDADMKLAEQEKVWLDHENNSRQVGINGIGRD